MSQCFQDCAWYLISVMHIQCFINHPDSEIISVFYSFILFILILFLLGFTSSIYIRFSTAWINLVLHF